MPDGVKPRRIPTPQEILGVQAKRRIPTPDEVFGTTETIEPPTQQYQQPSYFNLPIDTPESVLSEKVRKAHKDLNEELTTNTGAIKDLVRNEKIHKALLEDFRNQMALRRPGHGSMTAPNIHPSQEVLNYQPQVSEQETLEKAHKSLTEDIRPLVNQIAKSNPEKKKKMEVAMYVADSKDDTDRVGDIEKNIKDIKSDKINYDILSGRLVKPENFWQSLVTGWNKKDELLANAGKYLKMSNEQLADEWDREIAKQDDRHTPIPKGSEIGTTLGRQPVAAMVAGLAATAATSEYGGVGGPPMAALVGGPEFGAMTYAESGVDNYRRLKEMGVPRLEAAERANRLAKNQGLTDAAIGAAMSFVGTGAAKLPKINLSGTASQAFKEIAKVSGLKLRETASEALQMGALTGGGQVAKNIMASKSGIQADLGEGVLQAGLSGASFYTFMKLWHIALAKGGEGAWTGTKKGYNAIKDIVSKVDEPTSKKIFEEAVQDGNITEEGAANAMKEISDEKKKNESIETSFPNLTDEATVKIKDLISRREELDKKIEIADDAAMEGLKERRKEINAQILETAKDKIKPSEISEDAKIVNKAIDNGDLVDVNAIMAKADPEGFIKLVAEQALNKIDPEAADAVNSMRSAIETYGQEAVDYAIQKYPTKQKITLSTPNENKIRVGLNEEAGNFFIGTLTEGEHNSFKQGVELTKEEYRELRDIEAERELDGPSEKNMRRRQSLVNKIINRVGLSDKVSAGGENKIKPKVTVSTPNIVNVKSHYEDILIDTKPEEIGKLKENLTAVDMEKFIRKLESEGKIKIEC